MSDEIAMDDDEEAGHYEVSTFAAEDDDEYDDDAVEVRSDHLDHINRPPQGKAPPAHQTVRDDSAIFSVDEPGDRARYSDDSDDPERERLRLSHDGKNSD